MRKIMMPKIRGIAFLTLLLVVCVISGCRSFFSEEASGKRETIATEKAISESVPLQKLEATCRDLPHFRDRTPLVKAMSKQKDALYYYYQLDVPSKNVFDAVKGFMAQKGWTFSGENDGLWEHQYNFENSIYRIQVTHGRFGSANFATNCHL